MVADWYCVIDNRQIGPITAPQLKHLAMTGKLQPSHLVWKEGMQNRVPAQSVKGLFEAGAAAKAGKRSGPVRTEGPIDVEPIDVIPDLDEGEAISVDDIEVVEVDEEEEAKTVSQQTQKTPNKKVQPQAAPAARMNHSAPAPATLAPAGKPYRIFTGGKVRGFFSPQEIRQLFRSGKLPPGALIGIETWLPVATLGGLLGEGGPADKHKGGPGVEPAAVGDEEDEDEAVVAEEEDADEAAEDEEAAQAEEEKGHIDTPKNQPKEDSDSVSVDEEFQLD
jgi:GYF domain 2